MRLQEQDTVNKILELCKELSTQDEVLSFRGFLNGFNGQNSRVILYNSKLDLEWDTKYKNFASRKTKTPKLTESLALEVVKRKCIKLSEPDEVITFLGWKDNKWVGNKTHLILHNSKLNYTWDSTIYNSFTSLNIKRPKFFDENYYKQQVILKCQEISNENETITFLGWENDKWIDSRTKLILYNSRLDLTWNTTTYNDLTVKGVRYPSWELIPEEKKKLVIRDLPKHDTESIKNKILELFPNKNWDLSKVEYTGYDNEICIICNEIDPLTKRKHGEFYTTPNSLFSKRSSRDCPRCSGNYRYTTEEYIEKASILHNNFYGYTKTEYTRGEDNIIVTCPTHGDFYVTATSHINALRGCPVCSSSKGETVIFRILSQLGIDFKYQYEIDSSEIPGCPNKTHTEIDFFLENYNGRKIIIEFNGQQHYSFRFLFHKTVGNFRRQFLRDLSVMNYAKDNGIEYLEIPYCDFGKISEILEAFLQDGIDITTKLTREIWTGPDIPLGLPYYPNIP